MIPFNTTLAFYPNECFVCRTRSTLRRCSRCRLISYCGESHQKLNWNSHKDFCSAICQVLTMKNLSHIFEDLRGCNLQTWINVRKNMACFVKSLLHGNLQKHEVEMLYYPRSCVVCYDTRQDNLTNCSRCPLVSFCKEHPDTSQHEMICPNINLSHDLEVKFNKHALPLELAFFSIILNTPTESSRLPNSVAEYLDQNLVPELIIDKNMKHFMSLLFCVPLTIISALQKLNYVSSSKLTIHFNGQSQLNTNFSCWEIMLHFLPNLNFLKLIITEFDKTSNTELTLCPKCMVKKKKLIINTLPLAYPTYVMQNEYETANLVVFDNLMPLEKENQLYHSWKALVDVWPRLSCPLVLMADTERRAKHLRKNVNSSFWKPLICFEGSNNFASLFVLRDWEEWKILRPCQFLIITKAPKSSNAKEKDCHDPQLITKTLEGTAESVKQNDEISKNFFYPGICHVCKSCDAPMPCKRCKMIFYCGVEHAKADWSSHKEICKAILGIIKKKGTPHLYDNLKTTNEESWLNTKLAFIELTERKLQRELLNFERQMFLFPRTCLICHESDLSVLKICECGVSLCKIHREDSRHKNLCKHIILEFKFHMNEKPTVISTVKVPLSKRGTTLPQSMDRFINDYLLLKSEPSKLLIKDYEKFVVSEFLTRPLSLVYVLEKLRFSIPRKMIIHVIGATDKEVKDTNYWHTLLYWLNKLQYLQIIFIGTAISKQQPKDYHKHSLIFNDSLALDRKDFNMLIVPGSYDQFFRSGDFLKPDIVIGFNLDIHRNNLLIADITSSNFASIIKQLNIPFLMTTTSENKAKKNNDILCTLFEEMNGFEFFEKNPYGSLVPERDFETEELSYSNNYVICYTNFTKANAVKKLVSIPDCDNEAKLLTDDTNAISIRKKNEVKTKKGKIKNNGIQTKLENSEFLVENKSRESVVKDEQFGFRVNNSDLSIQISVDNEDRKAEVNANSEKLLKENLQLQEENKILKENLFLKNENERLKTENLILKKELATLKAENV